MAESKVDHGALDEFIASTLYQVIVVDTIYDNFEEVGWFDDLAVASKALKSYVLFALDQPDLTLVDGEGHELSQDDLERLVNMPDDFITEYVSTFNYAIDRPMISYEEIVEECFLDEHGDQKVFIKDHEGRWGISPDDIALSVRGFVHVWPKKVTDVVIDFWNDIYTEDESHE